jgi:hypothetical protein
MVTRTANAVGLTSVLQQVAVKLQPYTQQAADVVWPHLRPAVDVATPYVQQVPALWFVVCKPRGRDQHHIP